MIYLQVVETPKAGRKQHLLTEGVHVHEGSQNVSVWVQKNLHERRFNPPFQCEWEGRAGWHSVVTACVRPNLLAHDGDRYRFVGRAPSSSSFTTPSDLWSDDTIPVACGHCISCRVKRAIEWKIRGVHESQSTFHPTYAVTLTYDDEHLPSSGSLRRSDLQSFHRRLRYQTGHEFRFMSCGEYGPRTGRAHYHGIYFGLRLPDVYRAGKHFVSRTLLEAWGNGQVSFHLATPASIGYVSGYVVKKLRHQQKYEPIMTTVDFDTGLILDETPVRREFLQASNRPGIGAAWIEQFGDQVLEQGYLIYKEKPCYLIPSFYLKKLRDRPGFPAFQENRMDHLQKLPPLSPEDLQSLGVSLEAGIPERAGV